MAHTPNVITAAEMQQEWLAHQHRRHEHPDLYAPKSTGLKQLDAVLGGGIELGQLVYLSGEPGAGKTTLLETMSTAFGKQRVNSLFATIEMYTLQLGTMYFTAFSGVDRTKIRGVGLELVDWQKLEKAGEEIAKLTLAFDYGFTSVSDLVLVIEETEKKTGIPVDAVFGDYLHLMSEPTFRGSRTDEIAIISKGLNRLKNHDGILRAIVFAAQHTKEAVRNQLTQMTALHGSAQLGWDMDLGIIIENIRDELSPKRIIPNMKRIHISKSRETGLSEPIDVVYNGATATFSDKVTVLTKERSNYWE